MYLEGEEYLVFSQVYSILRGRSIKYLEGEKDEGSGSIPARQTAGKTIGGRVLLRLNAKVWKQEVRLQKTFTFQSQEKVGTFHFDLSRLKFEIHLWLPLTSLSWKGGDGKGNN